jgi:hypothetical protein
MTWQPNPGISRCWADRINHLTSKTDSCDRPSETDIGLCRPHAAELGIGTAS